MVMWGSLVLHQRQCGRCARGAQSNRGGKSSLLALGGLYVRREHFYGDFGIAYYLLEVSLRSYSSVRTSLIMAYDIAMLP